ncbi:restriction endonuclease subunit S [uncultured Marivirga sp.]|uniref:restriction endonuclease subunit S n=1 Tax=uncultured Marivirga sp. TaxID=1123707 RepID=UPI0030EEFFB7|tara:strand:- start:15778 stop:17742 length:1965 start_codon:yes stop_codon:yes gene_type:complete
MTEVAKYIHLKDLCSVNQGLQIPISKRFREPGENRFFYITVQFLKDGHLEKYYIENPPKSSICNPDDIIIVRTGSTGQILTGITGCFHNNFFKVNYDKNLVNGKYLYYCLTTKEKQREMKIRAGITTIPDLNHFMFLDMKIPFLPLKFQNGIVSVLDSINLKIELNKKINKQLEAVAKLIYDYWFVQFDFPISKAQAKAMGKPELEGKPYKNSGCKMVYSEALKREIPEGWEVKQVGDIVERTGTGLNPRNNFKLGEGENFYVTIKNIEQGRIVLDDKCDKISDTSLEIIDKRSNLKPGDILFTSIEPVGTTYLIKEKPINWNINESVFVITPNLEEVSSEYLYMFLSSDYMKAYTRNVAYGSIHKGIRHGTLKECKILVPQNEILIEFSQVLDPILDKLDVAQKENQKLSELRDWLLPMLMNGQVKVANNSSETKEYSMEQQRVSKAAENELSYDLQRLEIPKSKKGFAKQVLAGKIIKECKDSNDFTNIKLQKLMHLAEHLMEADLNLNYYNQAAGPFDNRFMHVFKPQMKQQKWFEKTGYRYRSLENEHKIDNYFDNYFTPKKRLFARLINLLGNASENQCEIISTLYAVWNDRIIKGEPVADDLLVNDFLNWSERKQKYNEHQLLKALDWMRENGIIPKGFGELIKHKKK